MRLKPQLFKTVSRQQVMRLKPRLFKQNLWRQVSTNRILLVVHEGGFLSREFIHQASFILFLKLR